MGKESRNLIEVGEILLNAYGSFQTRMMEEGGVPSTFPEIPKHPLPETRVMEQMVCWPRMIKKMSVVTHNLIFREIAALVCFSNNKFKIKPKQKYCGIFEADKCISR